MRVNPDYDPDRRNGSATAHPWPNRLGWDVYLPGGREAEVWRIAHGTLAQPVSGYDDQFWGVRTFNTDGEPERCALIDRRGPLFCDPTHAAVRCHHEGTPDAECEAAMARGDRNICVVLS